jgi:hypothetical protein
LTEVPLQTREGEVVRVDLQARASSASADAILVQLRAAGARQQAEQVRLASAGRLDRLGELAALMLDPTLETMAEMIPAVRELLTADAVGIYAVSSAEPEYLLMGSLPTDFPGSLPAGALDALPQPAQWILGQRPDHPLFRAGRSAGFAGVRTAPLGTATAWVGMLVAGWRTPESIPAEAEGLMSLLADLAHAALLLSLQRSALASLEAQVQALKAESRDLASAISDGLITVDDALRAVHANACRRNAGLPGERASGSAHPGRPGRPGDFLATLLDARHERQAERPHLTLHRRDGTPSRSTCASAIAGGSAARRCSC